MKKISFLFSLLSTFIVFGQIQQDVNKNGGQTMSQEILQIDSIRFNNAQMEIILLDGSIEMHQIIDINNVTFSEVQIPAGSISSLDCIDTTLNGTLTETIAANNVSVLVSYAGGNGGTHSGQVVTSTGVTGLTATLSAGNFANGTGTLTYVITGTPTSAGMAVFLLDIGGQTCTLSIPVDVLPPPVFTCGTSTVTFTYRGATVTYGTVVGADNKCWLDRNLGASQVAASVSDALAYGDLFQWGRLDDGHQDRNSATTTTQATTDVPGHGDFIRNSQNWRNPKNDNLWQGVNGINNPCPTDWRLPTLTEWTTERTSWLVPNINGAFSSLKLTDGGWRNTSGDIEYPNSGFYHSSDFLNSSPTNGTSMFAVENNYSGASSNRRSNGAYVRCIKD